jgi:hypothetical protein
VNPLNPLNLLHPGTPGLPKLFRYNRSCMTPVRCGLFPKALLAAYALAVALLPYSHHDLACHLKSSTHCVSCLASSSGEVASDAAPIDRSALTDAGSAIVAAVSFAHSRPSGTSSGRSPPVFA